MCTAITFHAADHYFGRTLDYETSFGERVVVTPRNFPLPFRCAPPLKEHHALIGMAAVADGYPLYFEATNEYGLSMAGLNFPVSAHYHSYAAGRRNIAPYELIAWLLGQCATVNEALTLLEEVNVVNTPFSPKLPLTPLHWLLADKNDALTVEPMNEGLQLHENTVGVLTNEPPFPTQQFLLANYMGLSREEAENRLSPDLKLTPYSRGMGAMGLPGDLSSPSRFVRAAFVKSNSVTPDGDRDSINQFFHILASVSQPKGCVHLGDGVYEFTRYTSCCNTDRGIYYYTTYDNSHPTGVDMHRCDLDGEKLISYPLRIQGNIRMEDSKAAEYL